MRQKEDSMKQTEHPSFEYLTKASRSLPKRDLLPLIVARLREDEKARKQVILLAAASVTVLLINVIVFAYFGIDSSVNEETVTGISELNNSFILY
jgi:transcriptional regulator of met regulon